MRVPRIKVQLYKLKIMGISLRKKKRIAVAQQAWLQCHTLFQLVLKLNNKLDCMHKILRLIICNN